MLQVQNFDYIVSITVFTNGLKDKDFTKKLPKVFANLLLRAKKYINMEEAMAMKYQSHDKAIKREKIRNHPQEEEVYAKTANKE